MVDKLLAKLNWERNQCCCIHRGRLLTCVKIHIFLLLFFIFHVVNVHIYLAYQSSYLERTLPWLTGSKIEWDGLPGSLVSHTHRHSVMCRKCYCFCNNSGSVVDLLYRLVWPAVNMYNTLRHVIRRLVRWHGNRKHTTTQTNTWRIRLSDADVCPHWSSAGMFSVLRLALTLVLVRSSARSFTVPGLLIPVVTFWTSFHSAMAVLWNRYCIISIYRRVQCENIIQRKRIVT